jgi:predicted GIY-YIG superfamily endonuclease
LEETAFAKPFFTYILICSDGSYYVGQTDDLAKRYAEHQFGGKCVYTTVRRPVKLVWSQEFQTRVQAKEAEAQIKRWSRVKKAALIRGDFELLSSAAKKKGWTGSGNNSESK